MRQKVRRMMSISRLNIVRKDLGDCRRCGLCETRKNIVFGSGHPDAPLMFVGEGPGADEDEQGLPFVGKAGEVLTKMIAAMGWTRDTVYIANIIKCRPRDEDGFNRPGNPEEVAECMPFLLKQIVAVRPLVVVTMGNLATKNLLGTEAGITRIRGTWHPKETIEVFRHAYDVMPTFHPANLLRAPENKRLVWQDLQAVGRRLVAHGVTPPYPAWRKST
jgi:uracil-DNA glycosylase